ncbi:CocE/NonD family hydrolase [Chitinophaga pinensis]|uniref:Peptidase S15 n=1 Tax=Chitinophaga pinensis (strain ATCC 43595 / DSM 2588 / LMG 13176 / NBRC 15968 / NCIMB 11800 / UQM 2034) TaxID=485918 RepID=A0A979G5P2_CHIPD|nr:CocE/NonD family hydrolase [Chitinophaga pinensis]ACU61097.1 peptidase S15 [Chitinophaga pinensis DSM 2588]
MRLKPALLIVTCFLLYGSLLSAQQKRYVIDSTLEIPLKDGTVLSCMLLYQEGAKLPLPVVLRANCYPSKYDTLRAQYVADSGYAGVFVYNRGKSRSSGSFYPMENDAADNYAAIDWISKQSWCNGKIAMYGGSYLGFAQWATVKKIHPALKTIVPQVAVGPGIDYPNPGGIFLTYMLQWLKYVRNNHYLDDATFLDEKKWKQLNTDYLLRGMPFSELDNLEGSGMDTIFQRWIQHPGNDEYWQQMTPTQEEFSRINIPILTTTGYFDDDQRGAIYYYNMHNKYGPAAGVKEHYLFIGPFDHAGGQGGKRRNPIPPYEIDTVAMVDQKQLVLDWFNYTLKDGPKPAFLQDRISVFAMGENKWHYFPSLEKMNRDTLTYYLPSRQEEAMSIRKRGGKKPLVLSFDAADTVDDTLIIYDGTSSLVSEAVFKKKYLLTLTTPPLDHDMILNGSITADLWLSSGTPDADLMFSWWEVDSEGKRWPLANTAQRLSLSIDKAKPVFWKENETRHISLENPAWMCKQLKKGSRIVMTISPAANLYWQKNYGAAKDVSQQTLLDALMHEIHFYPESHISIPVM